MIVSIIIQVDDEDNVDMIRSHVEEQANQIARTVEPKTYEEEETVSWTVEDN